MLTVGIFSMCVGFLGICFLKGIGFAAGVILMTLGAILAGLKEKKITEKNKRRY